MDSVLPNDVAVAIDAAKERSSRRGTLCRVRAGGVDLPVIELSETGFVIKADMPPPMRGYADVFRGEDRVLHGLVVCSWAENGLVGYEFKRSTSGRQISADHVATERVPLLEAPRFTTP